MSDKLPKGWTLKPLYHVAEIYMGQSPPSSTYNGEGNGLPFFQGKAEFGSLFPVPRKYCDKPVRIAEPGDILISVRAPVGPTNLCKQKSCIGRGLAAIRPLKGIPSLYILSFLRNIESWLSEQGTGSTFTAISRKDLQAIEIPLPPLSEQRRIVAKLEQLLAKVEACQKRLEKLPLILKRFRQSVLAAACSGKLTQDCRTKDQPAIALYLLQDQTSGCEEALPQGWQSRTLLDGCSKIIDGNYGADYPKKDEFLPAGIPFFTSAAIGEDGQLIESEIKFISPSKHAILKKAQTTTGDVLFTNRGARVGATAMLTDERLIVSNIGPQVTRLAANHMVVLPKYLFYWMRTPLFLARMKERNGGSAMNFLNLTVTKSLPLFLPPLSEQQEIVHRIEKLFKLADALEARYQKAKAHVDKLTQSILAKAFRGELVPQE